MAIAYVLGLLEAEARFRPTDAVLRLLESV
jgi:hypothetical protein